MAGKKPAKPMASQAKQAVKDPAIYGSSMMYIGSKNAPNKCPKCGKHTVRGMVRQKGDALFCSEICAKSS
jgi:hypothetical protein